MLSLKAFILLLDSFCVFAQIQIGKFTYQKDVTLSTNISVLTETSAPLSGNTLIYCALQCLPHPLCNFIELCHHEPDAICRLHKFPNPTVVNENDKGLCQYYALTNGTNDHEGCKRDWQQYDGRCYRFSESNGTFEWAKQWCKEVGGHLVRVDGPKENNWLTLQMRVKAPDDSMHRKPVLVAQFIDATAYEMLRKLDNLWIGATDVSSEGTFEWESNNAQIMYSDWAEGQPDNYAGQEHYVHINKVNGYKWNDIYSHYKCFSVCEK